jgi:hypothetical protein
LITDKEIEAMTREELHQHCLEMAGLIRNAAWRVVLGKKKSKPAWAEIGDTFGVGSQSAQELCRRIGIDPKTGEQIAT